MSRFLPPLSPQILHDVEASERAARAYLLNCGRSPDNFDAGRALRTLRTYAIKIFEIQSTYYFSLPEADQTWAETIESDVALSVSGLLSGSLLIFQEDIRVELIQTIEEHRKKWKPPLLNRAVANQTASSASGDDCARRRRASVDSLISKTLAIGTKIHRNDIWKIAGYINASEFERYQRCDKRATKTAIRAFDEVLALTPEEFLNRLKTRSMH